MTCIARAAHAARRALAQAAAIGLAAAACSPEALDDTPRRTAMREVTERVALAGLDELAARTSELAARARSLADAPTAGTLAAAHGAWRAARAPWKQSEAYGFGPAVSERLAAAIDQAIDPAKLAAELASTTPITSAYVDSLGADRRGFHAVEALIFRAGDDAGALAALTTDPGAPRRRQLAAALAEGVARAAEALRAAWRPETGGYAAGLLEPGTGEPRYPNVKAVVDAYLNQSVFLAERIADARLGAPLGLTSGGAPRPDLEESAPSDHSGADLGSALRGIQAVYFGALAAPLDQVPISGLGAIVARRSPRLDREVRDALGRALAAAAGIPRPFGTALTASRAAVELAYSEVKELKRILGTEVLSALGATLKFNDNDGD
jgi:predicted lipoprotein